MKIIISLLISMCLIGCGTVENTNLAASENITVAKKVRWEERLYTPTFITKIDEYYFIVDCWQHRIIYSKKVDLPIAKWEVLDDKTLGGPHSIATDGELLVVDNTGYHKVNVYKKDKTGKFKLHQEIEEIGNRPHRVIYSPEKKGFYVLGSISTDIHFFKNVDGKLQLEYSKKLDFLEEKYTRSFRIIDDKMYFVSGANKIVVANYLDDSFDILEEFDVPEELSGMNDIYKIDNYYYITSSVPQNLVRTDDLNTLKNSSYEDLYPQLGLKGTPYFFEKIGRYIYLTEITEHSSIIRFTVKDGAIKNVKRLHDFGLPTKESEKRGSEFPT